MINSVPLSIPVFNQQGEKIRDLSLPEAIFAVKPNPGLIHQALIHQLANKRIQYAHSKTRGLVRGGGRKPYRQKGTGSARQGSIRAPHYKGGGVVFGPQLNRNFSISMPRKQKRKALFCLLTSKANESAILALDQYVQDKPKTKPLANLLSKLNLKKKVLIILDKKDKIIQKSSSNLPNVKSILVNYLNPADLLKFKHLLFLEPALKKLETIFLKNNN